VRQSGRKTSAASDMVDVVSIVTSFLSGGISGGITGAVVSHVLAKRRETSSREHAAQTARDARKRDFLSFMDKWRAHIERRTQQPLFADFSERIAEFRGEQAKIRDDFVVPETRNQFDKLITSVASMRGSEVEKISADGATIGKAELVTRLDRIVEFVRSN